MTPGEIRWVWLPLDQGRSQGGLRPCVVLQDDGYAEKSPMVVIVPLTTSMHPLRYPGHLLITPTSQNGLTRPSVALVFQICAVDRGWVQDRIGHVETDQLQELRNLLNLILGTP